MKTILLVLSFLSMVACSGGGGGGAVSGAPGSGSGGGGSTNPPVDSTPHDYILNFSNVFSDTSPHPTTAREICNDGFAGFRDVTVNHTYQAPDNVGGIGCNAAKNIIFTATNNGTFPIGVIVYVDGVALTAAQMGLANQTLNPGQTYTFTRGY